MERGSNKFLGTITSHDVLDLMVLMNEIEDEIPTGLGINGQADA